jgi:hypothetical protein
MGESEMKLMIKLFGPKAEHIIRIDSSRATVCYIRGLCEDHTLEPN